VNEYREEETPPEGLLRVNKTVEKTQAARLKQLRSERDAATVKRRLDALRAAAKDEKQNLVPLILDAVKSLATLGEISDALREVFGEHRENVPKRGPMSDRCRRGDRQTVEADRPAGRGDAHRDDRGVHLLWWDRPG
jgi:hypothetical protein